MQYTASRGDKARGPWEVHHRRTIHILSIYSPQTGSHVAQSFYVMRACWCLNLVLVLLWVSLIVLPCIIRPPSFFSWNLFLSRQAWARIWQGDSLDITLVLFGGLLHMLWWWWVAAYVHPFCLHRGVCLGAIGEHLVALYTCIAGHICHQPCCTADHCVSTHRGTVWVVYSHGSVHEKIMHTYV